MNQLFERYKLHDTVSMADMNQLKQIIRLPTPQSNLQTMFEQIALVENKLKLL